MDEWMSGWVDEWRQQNCVFRCSKSQKMILSKDMFDAVEEILILLKIHNNYI